MKVLALAASITQTCGNQPDNALRVKVDFNR